MPHFCVSVNCWGISWSLLWSFPETSLKHFLARGSIRTSKYLNLNRERLASPGIHLDLDLGRSPVWFRFPILNQLLRTQVLHVNRAPGRLMAWDFLHTAKHEEQRTVIKNIIASRFSDVSRRLETTFQPPKIGDKGCAKFDETLETRFNLTPNSALPTISFIIPSGSVGARGKKNGNETYTIFARVLADLRFG